MTIQTFEEYLQDMHDLGYTGTDDDMPDAFDTWLVNITPDDFIIMAQNWGNMITTQTELNKLKR